MTPVITSIDILADAVLTRIDAQADEGAVVLGVESGGLVSLLLRLGPLELGQDSLLRQVDRAIVEVSERDCVAVLLLYYQDQNVGPGTSLPASTVLEHLRGLFVPAVPVVGSWVVSPGAISEVRELQARDGSLPNTSDMRAKVRPQLPRQTPKRSHQRAGRQLPLALDLFALTLPAVDRSKARAASQRWLNSKAVGSQIWREKSLTAWNRALRLLGEEGHVGHLDLGKIAAALADVRVRDAVMVSLAGAGPMAIAQAIGRNQGSDAVSKVMDTVMSGEVSADTEAIKTAERLLRTVAFHASSRLKAPPLTLVAYVQWWRGDIDGAVDLLDEALSRDGHYKLASLLEECIKVGLVPTRLS